MKIKEILPLLLGGLFITSASNTWSDQLDRNNTQKVSFSFLHQLEHSADQGDATAQVELARIFQMGLGVRSNLVKAAIWYKKAAAQGHADAQFNLGLMYLEGIGVTANSNEALHWISEAANQKHDSATEVYNYILNNDGPMEC